MLRTEVRVKGQIAKHWSSWFEGLTIAHTAEGDTVLSGNVSDQAALYGLLAKLRDLGLVLIAVNSSVAEDSEGGR